VTTTRRSRSAVLLVTVAGLLLPLVGLVAPAHAEGGYRYWSFWEHDAKSRKWLYATQGAATTTPADGAVQGFRFSVSQNSQDAAKPRGTADFDAVCARTPAKDATKRVALVLDFGTREDAPDGETPPAPRTVCAQVAEDATTAEALAEVARPLRYDSSALLCALAGYPRTGCAEQVSARGDTSGAPTAASPDATAPTAVSSHSVSPSDGGGEGPSAGVLVGLAAVLALGAAAVWQARRRRG
jgi:MYXO-CTERM domain-containing protein